MTENQDSIVSAVDVVAHWEQLERDAAEALPGRIDQCTFALGHVRQPIYACLTCCPGDEEDKEGAGFCYACSISCHGDHQVLELFTKRNFRCDCGVAGTALSKHPCALTGGATEKAALPSAEESTNHNRYSHNFFGRYCYCDSFYDPETETAVCHQCVVCEDWFHDRCLGVKPEEDAFQEQLICRLCVDKHSWLLAYVMRAGQVMAGESRRLCADEDGGGAVEAMAQFPSTRIVHVEDLAEPDAVKSPTMAPSKSPVKSPVKVDSPPKNSSSTSLATHPHPKRSLETVDDSQQSKKPRVETAHPCRRTNISCKYGPLASLPEFVGPKLDLNRVNLTMHRYDLFANTAWKEILCACEECVVMYRKEQVEFLLGEDPIVEPEPDENGTLARVPALDVAFPGSMIAHVSTYEAGLKALEKMDRSTAMHGLISYDAFRSEILKFLTPFAENQQVVTKQDIEAFFDKKDVKKL